MVQPVWASPSRLTASREPVISDAVRARINAYANGFTEQLQMSA